MGSLSRTNATSDPFEHAPRPRGREAAGRARRLRRRLLVPVAMMSFAVVAAGCNDDGSASDSSASPAAHAGSTTPSPASSQPSTDPAPSDSAPPTSSPGASGGSDADAAGPGRCTADGLGMSVKQGDGGAGQVYYDLTFVNKSSHSCTLNGFPGVSLIQRDGSVIGKPAKRDGASHGSTVIGAGKTAHVVLHTLNQGIADGGCWKQAAYLRVYPPGSKEALTLRDPQVRVCGDRFTTTSVEG
ncbi:DUF4232 domain-containing protein [Streptomyces sp. NPDC047803]|uniref:DUF4232 domain-containing protein n=1 Tax=Streptomyces TaxID=1883 RepID=UPI0033CF8DFA